MKKDRPLISVIVPNFNHSQFLGSRLDSIFNQTYQNFEVILLDDCSTDKSQDLLLQYSNHRKVSHCLFNKKNSGSTFNQWNKGIALAKGNFVWIAESDDFCEDTFLEQLLKPHLVDCNCDLALSFCQSHRVNSEGEVTGNWITHTAEHGKNAFEQDFKMDGDLFIENYLIHKNVIPNVSAVLFKKKKLDEITPLVFKPFMKYNADWFYYIQLLCNSHVAFVADTLNYFRYHENSVIAKAGGESGWIKIFKMELEVRKQILKFLLRTPPPNLDKIQRQAKIGDNRLYQLIAKGFINKQNYLKGLSVVWNKPYLLKKAVKHAFKKITQYG